MKRELQERRVPKDRLAGMASRAPWDCQDQQVLLDLQERMETRVRSGSLGRRAAKVTRGSRVPQAPLVPRVQLVSLAQLELMESPGPEDSKASLVRKVMKDPEGSLVPLALWACRACLDRLGRREKRVTLARWAHQAHQDPEVHLGHQEQTVHRVLLEE